MPSMTLAMKAVLTQIIVGLFAIIIAGIVTPSVLFSVAAGVIVMWCAVAYLLYKLWRLERTPGAQPQVVANALYIAQAVKFMVLVIGVVLVMLLFTVNWIAFLVGVMVVQVGNMLTSLQMKRAMAS